MDLAEKFRRFQQQQRQQQQQQELQRQDRQGLQQPQGLPANAQSGAPADQPAVASMCRELGMQACSTPWGWVCVRETSYPPNHVHGRISLGSFVQLPPGALALLSLPPAPLPPTAWAFLDTETTGLAGGAGTMVFLCGVAYFRDGSLSVRQYLSPGPAGEPALVSSILADLQPFPGLVTFNGKIFDWPLLHDRLVLHRQQAVAEPVHADLLFPSRWLFRPLVSSCRLQCLEAEILGSPRLSDIPGELIPSLYTEYLRTGNALLLEPVLAHNLTDLLSLVALACRLLQPWLDPTHAHPEELYGLARLLAARGMTQEAIPLWETALSSLPPSLAAKAGYQLGILYRRLGNPHQAAQVWQWAAESSGTQGTLAPVEPLLELAKYHEHVTKDLEEARRVTLQALRRLWRRQGLEAPSQGTAHHVMQELQRRLDRIERKMVRPQPQGRATSR